MNFPSIITPGLDFWYDLLSIILINLILSGDNAVVIAMAVQSLPENRRKKGFIPGVGLAVVLRILLTFFISQLLGVPYLKLIGGLLILWIAIKLFEQGAPGSEREREAATFPNKTVGNGFVVEVRNERQSCQYYDCV